MRAVALALGPFRRLIKDYHMIVASHEQAVTEGGHEARIQAIDMGRRGLHNEGAESLTAAAGGPHRAGFRNRPAAVHPGLRAAPADRSHEGPADEDRRHPLSQRLGGPADGWSVRILDQTKLPWTLEILRLTDLRRRRRMPSAPCRCAARR